MHFAVLIFHVIAYPFLVKMKCCMILSDAHSLARRLIHVCDHRLPIAHRNPSNVLPACPLKCRLANLTIDSFDNIQLRVVIDGVSSTRLCEHSMHANTTNAMSESMVFSPRFHLYIGDQDSDCRI